MATRRPNVPRVSHAARAPEADQDSGHGAEVIRADFGAAARAAAARAGAGKHAPAGAGAGIPAAKPGPKKPAGAGKVQEAADVSEQENLDPVPAKAFSGRMLALAVVMIAITVMLAPTVKIFIDKRAEISALNADIASKQAEQAELNQQISRWQDPNYVKQQARDRINMVMPGETSYWVFGSDLPAENLPAAPNGAAAGSATDVPWVDALWDSVKRSGTD